MLKLFLGVTWILRQSKTNHPSPLPSCCSAARMSRCILVSGAARGLGVGICRQLRRQAPEAQLLLGARDLEKASLWFFWVGGEKRYKDIQRNLFSMFFPVFFVFCWMKDGLTAQHQAQVLAEELGAVAIRLDVSDEESCSFALQSGLSSLDLRVL